MQCHIGKKSTYHHKLSIVLCSSICLSFCGRTVMDVLLASADDRHTLHYNMWIHTHLCKWMKFFFEKTPVFMLVRFRKIDINIICTRKFDIRCKRTNAQHKRYSMLSNWMFYSQRIAWYCVSNYLPSFIFISLMSSLHLHWWWKKLLYAKSGHL